MRITYDGNYATSTPSSIAFEADCVDLRASLGVNKMLWYGYGSSESSVMGVFWESCSRVPAGTRRGGRGTHWGDSWNTQEEVE